MYNLKKKLNFCDKIAIQFYLLSNDIPALQS